MSLVLRQAGSLKPEIRLAQAVSEFEATLAPEQKSSFQASRARAVSTAPTMSDVMRLTAEIDLKATSKHGRGRCFGPRMTNTLQAIQQFAALGDIIVGGGQNLIACGVWAAARMTLHVITGYFTYLENLSLLFMTIGRNAPRYQTMASLYPKSKSLQRYLCEYFIVITKLCHQSVTWTKKPALSRLSSAISDPEMKTFKDDLLIWSSAINEDVNLLLNQTVVEEAKQNSLFRSFATSRSETFAHQRKIERQIRYLDACSRYDYHSTWKQKRKCGSTQILTDCQPYQQWKVESMNTSILFLGKLGAGKSVLLANIVDDLNLKSNTITIYFFARHDSEESRKTRTIFGCLLRQLLEHLMDDTQSSHLFSETVSQLDVDDMMKVFQLAKPSCKAACIVLDGLDECETEVQRTALQNLTQMQTFGYGICLSVRSSEQGLIWKAPSFKFHVSIPEDNPDIKEYIESEVDNRVKDGRLVTSDPDLVEEVKKELIAGACGMFLWTSLQLDSICSEVSDHDIREAIQDLPWDLTETFRRNLARASSNDQKKHHVRIFKLLASAKELLTTEQLRQAGSVTIGQPIWNSDKEITSIDLVLKFCGSLVMVDEEEETVRFIHHSARSFCIKDPHYVTDWTFTETEADQHMSEVLVTYLSYDIFDTRVSRVVVPTIDASEIPKRVTHKALSPYRVGRNIAEKVFRSTSRVRRDIGPALIKSSINRSQPGQTFPLLGYAQKNWLRHTSKLPDLSRLPQWHVLLEHLSFGIDLEQLHVRLVDERSIRSDMDLRLRTVAMSTPDHTFDRIFIAHPESFAYFQLILDITSLQYSRTITSRFTEYRNLYWALCFGHLLTLRHELRSPRGFHRVKVYARLWSMLRYTALYRPSVIQNELDYELVCWLCPMFVNLAMDHPAKQYFLGRIPISDDNYLKFVKKAMEQKDIVAICALVRQDYIDQQNLPIVERESYDGMSYQVAVPLILEAALSKPPRKDKVAELMQTNNLWLFDLISWICLTDIFYPDEYRAAHEHIFFFEVGVSLRRVGISEHELDLMERASSHACSWR